MAPQVAQRRALTPQANLQRNSIAQAMMNVANPRPQLQTPNLPVGRPLMGLPQTPAPGAPPTGTPLPAVGAPPVTLSPGVPPQPGMGTAMTGAPPMQPQGPMMTPPTMPQGPGY